MCAIDHNDYYGLDESQELKVRLEEGEDQGEKTDRESENGDVESSSNKNENTKKKDSKDTKPGSGPKKRAKYSRPCDMCALRKVRCSDVRPCTRCVHNKVECTSNRVRKKSGPKRSRSRSSSLASSKPRPASTRRTMSMDSISRSSDTGSESALYSISSDSISRASSTDTFAETAISELQGITEIVSPQTVPDRSMFSIENLLMCLDAYQGWFYNIWPVVSVAELASKVANLDLSKSLTYPEASSYVLALSIAAAVVNQVQFFPNDNNPILPGGFSAFAFAAEAQRVRDAYRLAQTPATEVLLSSFFLYIYSINELNGTAASILFLKEAIAMAQTMELQNPLTYLYKSPVEAHQLTKIYYLLLVTEKFMCTEYEFPSVLETNIALPLVENDEFPDALVGFIDLIKVFVVPDRSIFEYVTPEKVRIDPVAANETTTTAKRSFKFSHQQYYESCS